MCSQTFELGRTVACFPPPKAHVAPSGSDVFPRTEVDLGRDFHGEWFKSESLKGQSKGLLASCKCWEVLLVEREFWVFSYVVLEDKTRS